MDDAPLNLEKRNEIGGGRVRRLRDQGYIPAVVYGRGAGSIAAQVKTSEFKQFLSKSGKNSVFTTEFAADEDLSVLVKDLQYDAFHREIIHVDFQRVSMNEKISVNVPVKIAGRERIEKGGNVIAHQLNEITVECLPNQVPRYLEADVSGLTPGHSLTASQLKLPQGVSLVNGAGEVVLSVTGGGLELKSSKAEEPAEPELVEGSGKGADTAGTAKT